MEKIPQSEQLAPGTRCYISGLAEREDIPTLNGGVVIVADGPIDFPAASRPGPWYEIEASWISNVPGQKLVAHRDQLKPVEATLQTRFVASY